MMKKIITSILLIVVFFTILSQTAYATKYSDKNTPGLNNYQTEKVCESINPGAQCKKKGGKTGGWYISGGSAGGTATGGTSVNTSGTSPAGVTQEQRVILATQVYKDPKAGLTETYKQCLKREPDSVGLNHHVGLVQGGKGAYQVVTDICFSPEAMNLTEGEGANGDGGSPSDSFLWKPVSESDGKAVTLLPTSLRGTVIKTDLLDAGNLKIETGKFSGDEHNGMRPHYRFSKPGSSYGKNIQVVAVVPEGAWIWKIPDGGKRADGIKGRFVTNAEMAAWDAMHAAQAYNQSLNALANSNPSGLSCPAGQVDMNVNKNLKVLAMGDSNTRGTDSSNFLSYRKLLKEKMTEKGYTIDFVGSRCDGGTALSDCQHEGYPGEGIARLQSVASASSGNIITSSNPDIVLLLIGSNDMWVSLENRVPISDSAANAKVTALTTLVDTIHQKAPNAKIIIAKPGTPNNTAGPLGIYKTGINTIAASRSTYVSVVDFTGFASDGVHYTAAGYTSIATTFANKIHEVMRRCMSLGTTSTATSTATTTRVTTAAKELSVECKVSDTTPAIDDDIDIWVEIEGGTEPYTIKWSGDENDFDDFDDEGEAQTVTAEKRGTSKLKVTVEDDDGEKVKDSCPSIKVSNDGEDDDVIVRVVDTNTNVATTNTTTSTNTSSSYPYSRDLTVGASGADVAALQQYLVARGYLVMPAGVAYGYFGEVTRTAVARWQTAMGISPAAGYFGARSRAALGGGTVAMPAAAPAQSNPGQSTSLNSYYQSINTPAAQNTCVNISSTIYFGEQSENVAAIQKFLERGGYLVMPDNASYGSYGKNTVTALSKFMSVRGIQHQGAIIDSKILSEIKAVSCQ